GAVEQVLRPCFPASLRVREDVGDDVVVGCCLRSHLELTALQLEVCAVVVRQIPRLDAFGRGMAIDPQRVDKKIMAQVPLGFIKGEEQAGVAVTGENYLVLISIQHPRLDKPLGHRPSVNSAIAQGTLVYIPEY